MKKKIKFYENGRDFNSINLTNINNINVIKIDGDSRKINNEKINAIFGIKKIIILYKKLNFHLDIMDSLETIFIKLLLKIFPNLKY